MICIHLIVGLSLQLVFIFYYMKNNNKKQKRETTIHIINIIFVIRLVSFVYTLNLSLLLTLT